MTRIGIAAVSMTIFLAGMATVSIAQDTTPPPSSLQVGQYAFCTAVEDRQPVNPAESFPADVGKVFLWTSIMNPENVETQVKHVWYYGDTKVAEVPLAVSFSRTRTWSSKEIPPFRAEHGMWMWSMPTTPCWARTPSRSRMGWSKNDCARQTADKRQPQIIHNSKCIFLQALRSPHPPFSLSHALRFGRGRAMNSAPRRS